MDYQPPSAQQLQALKSRLGYTGKQMAALACVGEQHWRKYTGGAQPKSMPYPNLFHLAAQMTLTQQELTRVYAIMREIGGYLEIAYPGAGAYADYLPGQARSSHNPADHHTLGTADRE